MLLFILSALIIANVTSRSRTDVTLTHKDLFSEKNSLKILFSQKLTTMISEDREKSSSSSDRPITTSSSKLPLDPISEELKSEPSEAVSDKKTRKSLAQLNLIQNLVEEVLYDYYQELPLDCNTKRLLDLSYEKCKAHPDPEKHWKKKGVDPAHLKRLSRLIERTMSLTEESILPLAAESQYQFVLQNATGVRIYNEQLSKFKNSTLTREQKLIRLAELQKDTQQFARKYHTSNAALSQLYDLGQIGILQYSVPYVLPRVFRKLVERSTRTD